MVCIFFACSHKYVRFGLCRCVFQPSFIHTHTLLVVLVFLCPFYVLDVCDACVPMSFFLVPVPFVWRMHSAMPREWHEPGLETVKQAHDLKYDLKFVLEVQKRSHSFPVDIGWDDVKSTMEKIKISNNNTNSAYHVLSGCSLSAFFMRKCCKVLCFHLCFLFSLECSTHWRSVV